MYLFLALEKSDWCVDPDTCSFLSLVYKELDTERNTWWEESAVLLDRTPTTSNYGKMWSWSRCIVLEPLEIEAGVLTSPKFCVDYNALYWITDFPGGSDDKESACNAGDPTSIPGSGRSPGEGNSNPFQYSCLENSMDSGVWWDTVHGVAKRWTWLKD